MTPFWCKPFRYFFFHWQSHIFICYLILQYTFSPLCTELYIRSNIVLYWAHVWEEDKSWLTISLGIVPLLWDSLWLSLVPVVLFVTLWSSQRFPTRSDCCSAQPRQNSIQVLTRPASPSLTTLFPVTLPQSGPSWRTMRCYLQCSVAGWDRNQSAPKLPGNWLLVGQRKRVCERRSRRLSMNWKCLCVFVKQVIF